MMAGIKGYAWNCGGLRRNTPTTLNKVMFFEKTFKNTFDFFFFLETHHKDKNDIPNELARFKDTHHIHDSPTKTDETHTGIIALIDKKYSVTDVKEIMQGRILSFQLSDPSTKLAYQIIAVYLPTNQNLNRDNMQDIVRRLTLNDPSENTQVKKF